MPIYEPGRPPNFKHRAEPIDFKKFEANGERTLTRIDVEDSGKHPHVLAPALADDMKENLFSYLYVTTPVRGWQVQFVWALSKDFAQDYWIVRGWASGWFDYPNDGVVEHIEL